MKNLVIMKKAKIIFLIAVFYFIALSCKDSSKRDRENALLLAGLVLLNSDYYFNDPNEQYAGGDTTTFDITESAFDLEASNLLEVQASIRFQNGNANFNRVWLPAGNSSVSGLGPTFNNSSCQGCHVKDGRGRPPEDGTSLTSMLLRLSKPNVSDPTTSGPVGLDNFGGQLNTFGITEFVAPNKVIPKEGTVTIVYAENAGNFPDGEAYSLRKPTYTITWNADGTGGGDASKIHANIPSAGSFLFSPRTAPIVPGLGLLEAISEETLEGFETSNADAVSGRRNQVWDTELGAKRTGRFGWKANQPNLRHQNASAFLGDVGLTTPVFTSENCPTLQTLCSASATGQGLGTPEISNTVLNNVTFYTALVGVPGRRGWRDDDVRSGKRKFIDIGCAKCHIPRMSTGNHPIREVANQEIRPYTDLLIHDMGEALSDGRPDFDASGSEWRTPPLWGVGLYQKVNGHELFMHDGRARGFQEAILWHGGEAENAKQAYMNLPKADRDKLLTFLRSL